MTEATVNDHENFAIELTDKCKTHAQWLSVMRFGLGTLVNNQPLLIECLVREATREAERFNDGRVTGLHVAADHARTILAELGLRFEVTA